MVPVLTPSSNGADNFSKSMDFPEPAPQLQLRKSILCIKVLIVCITLTQKFHHLLCIL